MTLLRPIALLLAASGALLTAQEAQARVQRIQEDEVRPLDDRTGPLKGIRGITDNATLRREAWRLWFGEWSPEFSRFMMHAAQRERQAFRSLMPRTPGSIDEVMAAAPATGTWRNLGPTRADVIKNGGSSLAKTDSGRPRTILVDPANNQVIYVATAGGGVWKTTNGGTSWQPITETLGALSCGYLAMDPVDSQTLYLGLGDPFDGTGIGIVKSTDGGANWGAVQTLGASRKIQNVTVHPQNRQIVMVATNAGLFRSEDGGASYAQVATVPAGAMCWDIVWTGGTSFIASAETDPANASGATAGRVFRSTDNGATWAATTGLPTTGTRISLGSAPSNRNIAYAMASNTSNELLGVYRSVDGGASWTSLSTTGITTLLGGQGFYNHMVLVDRSNSDTVYLGGQLAVMKSTNGGGSWTTKSDWLAQNGLPYVHADFHCGAQDSAGNLYVGTDGGIFKSTDGGTTWSDSLNVGITSHLIYSVGSSNAAPDAVIGGFQDNGTRVRSGATSTFNQYIGGDGFGALMHPKTAGTMLGSLYYTRIQKSTNGGSTFTTASTGITESNNSSSAPFITVLAPGPADSTGNTVYTFANTKVYKSTNYATSWTAMGTSGLPTTSFGIRNVGAAQSNANVVGLVANSSRVFLTANGGSSWTQAGALSNSAGYLSSVAFDPTDHNVVYVTSVAGDSTKNHVWKSTNFGATWTTVDGNGFPAGVPVNKVVVDPGDRQVVYAATHLGLYRSGDAGTSWTRWGNGLPLVNVMDVYVAPDSSKVRVATFGRGFWELDGTATPTAPAITGQPQSVAVNAGQTAQFTVTATGTAPLTYQWQKNGAPISGATTASYTTPITTSTDNGSTFTVVVTNSVASTTSNPATLTVNSASAPAITTQPASQTVTAGQTATFSVVATGTGPLSYQWKRNGTTLSGATSASYTTPATTTTDSGSTYSVTVSNSAGSVDSSAATLTVQPVTQTERVVNGGFESGVTGWTGTTAAIGAWSTQGQPAFEGSNSAWLGGNGKSSTETLSQDITIPAGAPSAMLTFALHIDTKESSTTKAYDTLTVTVRNTAGAVLSTLATYSNLNKATGYQVRSFDLSAYKGQTIRLHFNAVEDSSLATNFMVDAVSVK